MGTKKEPVPVTTSTFCLALGCLIVGAILQPIIGQINFCFKMTDLFFLFVMTIASLCNQVLAYYANKFEKSPVVALILTAKAPILLIMDFFLFPQEAKEYNWLHYVGGCIVFG